MMTIRRATPEDVHVMAGGDMRPEWCIGAPVGFAADRDGELAALGTVTWDRYGRAWGWFNRRGAVSAFVMHRTAIEMLRLLREVEEPALYAICNPAIAGSDKWLRRLGFALDATLQHELGPIYRCDLST